jgi:uncharacterized zinc-type alcohol dehydrogenase-like protein
MAAVAVEQPLAASMDRGEEWMDVLCMACEDKNCDFKPTKLQRRAMGDNDVVIDMKYCGICHTDLHWAANHMKGVQATKYPCVPGHELCGVAVAVGKNVTKITVGQNVGIGCMVDSCMKCKACKSGEEQKCMKQVATYQGNDNNWHGQRQTYPAKGKTLGGYTDRMVVDENFAINIPDGYPLECAGPVMCAGVTMYDPMIKQNIKAGDRVGIVGLGGLGQMGIKIAKALGCEVTAISRSDSKRAYATECGATSFVASGDKGSMQAGKGTLDLILNTVPAYHDYCAYNSLLNKKGRQVLLGLHKGLAAAAVSNAILCDKSCMLGSGIGGIAATQAVIDLCAQHDIRPTIEMVGVDGINEVYTKLDGANPDGKRYVIDIATLDESATEKCSEVQPPTLKQEFKGGLSLCGIVCECCKIICCCKWC